MPPLEAIGRLLYRLALTFASQRGFEAGAVGSVVLLEVVPQRAVVLRFGVVKADPPGFARGVDALGVRIPKYVAAALGFVIAISQ
jgi:hypothetical protein